MQNNKIPVIVIVGPTATGKTRIGIEVAKRYNGEIISGDSMQVYTGLNIGTSKPSKNEMEVIKHHLIDIVDINEKFDLSTYINKAHGIILDIHNSGKMPIVVGGTGLYIDTLIKDIILNENESNYKLRDELIEYGNENGVDLLFSKLLDVDKESADKIDKNNIYRVARAIEIFHTTGIKMSEHKEKSIQKDSRYNALWIGLNYADRDLLYDIINNRVDMMIKNGLQEEAFSLFNSRETKTATQAIAYKELFPYFNREIDFDKAISNLKQNSRRYAKRQITWFSKNNLINWVYRDNEDIKNTLKKIYFLVDNFFSI